MPVLPTGTTPLTSAPTVDAVRDNTNTSSDSAHWAPSGLADPPASFAAGGLDRTTPGGSTQQPHTSTVARPQVASATLTNSASNTGQSEGPSGSSDDAAGPDETATQPIPIIAERFKTKMCKNYETTAQCQYGARCMFAHGARELRTTEQNMADGITNQGSVYALRRRMARQAKADASGGGSVSLAKRGKAAGGGAAVASPTLPAPTAPSAPSSVLPPAPHLSYPYPAPLAAFPHPLTVAATVPGVPGGSVAPLAPALPHPTPWASVPMPIPPPPPSPPLGAPVPMMPMARWW
eukprot:CAMPEP_0174878044 /NCGR_PEP_ID=MMETSP1114-20130205/82561_1 /TAXON_ID=312471 /ORGANISM="Neobodo designis, Strain CCAP 1951/1" /LENGTH=292 /DNA_ID=CAMNT_0016113431 /DNA_START=269 /DNA_END=1147 /DNA_ORIENTATION=+